MSKGVGILNRHLYLVLLVPLIFIIQALIPSGVVLLGDFPLIETSLDNYKSLWLWLEYGSYHAFEILPRYPIIVLGNFFNSINIGPEIISKFLVILGFSTASFSFYFSYIILFKDKLSRFVTLHRISAIIGSLFYAYNVWSFHRIGHWYLWLGYAIVPLFFVLLIYAFKNPKQWKYAIVTVLLWTVASSTPHMSIFYGLIYLAFSIYFLLKNLNNRPTLIKVAILALGIASIYLLINMFWIYPTVQYNLNAGAGTLLPSAHITEEMTSTLSRDSSFLNVLRLIEDWWQPRITEVSPSQTSSVYPLWLFASFVVPVVAFSALVLKRNSKHVLLFSSIGIIGIVLTLGTNAPYNLYSKLLFELPLSSTLQYVLRDPDKWAFLVALAYSFLLSISSFEILKKLNTMKRVPALAVSCFIILILVSLLVYCYPIYTSTSQKLLYPVDLPNEYDRLNQFLQSTNAEKVYFLFQDSAPTTWNKEREFCCLDQKLSIKPNTMNYLPSSRYYHDYITNSILYNRTNDIHNFISPLGTSYLLYSNDELNPDTSILRKISTLRELKNLSDVGFFKIFKVGENDNLRVLQIPNQRTVIVGGLDLFTSLNSLPSFSTINSSLVFLDQSLNKKVKHELIDSADFLISAKSRDDLTLSFLDEKYILKPFDATYRDDPARFWSRSVTGDPENADFQPELQRLGINNWDLDYGKGIAMTMAMGSNLTLPIDNNYQNVNNGGKTNNLYLFLRYLRNQEGGPMQISLDGKVLKEVDSYDRVSNKFVWEQIALINMTKKTRDLTIQNIAGFNAVNLLAIVPVEEFDKLNLETANLLENKINVVSVLEAESSFYNVKGTGNESYIFQSDNSINASENQNTNTSSRIFAGQLKVPSNYDLVNFRFFSNENSDARSSVINELHIVPAYEKYNVFTSNFEDKSMEKNSLDLGTLRNVSWLNENKETLSISNETNEPISGNASLRVDVRPTVVNDERVNTQWSIVSTDPIQIRDNAYYNASLDISAKDVKQLHSRILYFDTNMRQITNRIDLIFEGMDGTFRGTYHSSLVPPKDAKYIKYQILTSSAISKPASYVADNMKLDDITGPGVSLKNKVGNNFDEDPERYKMELKKEGSLETQSHNSSHYITQTGPLPVKENYLYNYSINAEVKNTSSLFPVAIFTNSKDVVENSSRHGNNASNGQVLSLNPGSEVETTIEILKSSYYSIALRAKTCQTCTFLKLEIDDNTYNKNSIAATNISNISLKNNNSELKWLPSELTYLREGTYKFRIYSDSQTDLDSVVIYPIDKDNMSVNNSAETGALGDLFNAKESLASIGSYKKINPTKYQVNISNATGEYLLEFSESYDPLWKVYVGQNDNVITANSIPLFSTINGFIINKTGDYTLNIEYEPQQWFNHSAMLSIFGVMGIAIIYLTSIFRTCLQKSRN